MAAASSIGFVAWNLIMHLLSSVDAAADDSRWTWFFSNQMYYLLHDNYTTLNEAHCSCNSLPGARLAAFDQSDVTLDDVTDYLSLYYPQDSFWLDADKAGTDPGSDFFWKMSRCQLPHNSYLWASGEPAFDEYQVELKLVSLNDGFGNFWKYHGTKPQHSGLTVTNRPLCQSVLAPRLYLPTPPVLTWIRLGETGHMFGFSNETLCLTESRDACSHQAGQVYLATLETLYDEVANYILDNHPERTYWLHADITTAPTSTYTEWSSGTSIMPSLLVQRTADSVVMFNSNGYMKLTTGSSYEKHYFVCRGHPTTEPNTTASTTSGWVTIGSPAKKFWFSTDTKTFTEAQEACAGHAGNVRLAVLDTLKSDVTAYMSSTFTSSIDFYVGASKPSGSGVDFFWEDGKEVTGLDTTPQAIDCAVTLTRTPPDPNIQMISTPYCRQPRRYICEQVPDVTLEWRWLGSPLKLFGFSRTRSWGLDWARHACRSQRGYVTLANLDTHFHDVSKAITKFYPQQEFWVDATPTSGGTLSVIFQWSNRVMVDSSMWVPNGRLEPNDVAGRMKCVSGRTFLHATTDSTRDFYFVCQGQPATPVTRPDFGPMCEVTTATTPPATTPAPSNVFGTMICGVAQSFNVSDEQLANMIQDIRKDLLLDPKDLSSTKRKRSSARDKRTSAAVLGAVGFALLFGAPLAFLVVTDIGSPIANLVRKISGAKPVSPMESASGAATDPGEATGGDCGTAGSSTSAV